MSTQRRDDDPPALTKLDEIDQLFGRAHTNPDRAGCPAREILMALSRRARPIGDGAYEHLTRCSPCYVEVRAMQQTARARRERIVRLVIAVAVVVAILLVARPVVKTARSLALKYSSSSYRFSH
jgi:hypothetical protein